MSCLPAHSPAHNPAQSSAQSSTQSGTLFFSKLFFHIHSFTPPSLCRLHSPPSFETEHTWSTQPTHKVQLYERHCVQHLHDTLLASPLQNYDDLSGPSNITAGLNSDICSFASTLSHTQSSVAALVAYLALLVVLGKFSLSRICYATASPPKKQSTIHNEN